MDIAFHPITVGTVVGLLVLILLLIISGLMSGSESAYFSLSPADLKKLESKSHQRAQSFVLINLNESERLLATILIVDNLVNVGIVILSTYLTNSLIDFSNAPVAGFIFQVIVITFILLLFGEVMPKILATNRALKFALFMAYPLHLLVRLFRPLSSLLLSSTSRIGKRASTHNQISMDELSNALEITSDSIAEEKQILQGIVTFGSTIVSEIMKPRIDVVAVEYDTSFNHLKNVVVDSGYSRIPVYSETFDSIRGILYVKDLIPYIDREDDFHWQNLIRTPYFVPESKRINDLLSEFQLKRIHMAIVVDEYGGTCGIITLEDILEEIVGEISDESDDETPLYTVVDSSTYIFEGKILLNDFCKVIGCSDDVFDDVRGEAETLAGLILEITGQFPSRNDVVTCKQFEFTVDMVDSRRIKRVKVKVHDREDEQSNSI
ncbi:MAG TPA: gliding motility-associated protein GldE [Tenuifilaceae bacterium]|jgi:gliding motility-associated protein GldE|nr:gliding motility-associated protein GldE [Bacteroidales bacterium]HNY09292.1 gliding motility-associated protein GldE [Tenuifilaceae bacterium]HOA08835.1 gliding motility-associated protein GldE [Tenuifilaceae bacterium]HOC35821.1 gliding motility-associated protein GldE [Tenuifilaceae bacterium]HOG71483.1 gliding motility-associated protein GldE [Tenuifilaceae bacterium]